MNTIKKLTSLLVITVFAFTFSCKNNTGNNNNTPPQNKEILAGEVSADDFETKLNASANAQVIDVRTPEEFADGHLNHAANVNWNGNDFDEKILTFDKNTPTFVYCLAGSRSHDAATHMKTLGFTDIYELKGGIKAWKKAGKTLATTGANNEAKKGMSAEEFKKQITTSKLVLVDFNAPWCGPCKKMSPILDEIGKEQKGKLEVVKINSDENEALSTALSVINLPTLFIYKNGEQVWKHEGFLDKIALMIAIEEASH